jgi:hypothetical protein
MISWEDNIRLHLKKNKARTSVLYSYGFKNLMPIPRKHSPESSDSIKDGEFLRNWVN